LAAPFWRLPHFTPKGKDNEEILRAAAAADTVPFVRSASCRERGCHAKERRPVSGKIVEESEEAVTIKTEYAGKITYRA
jgi:hypothetical protein